MSKALIQSAIAIAATFTGDISDPAFAARSPTARERSLSKSREQTGFGNGVAVKATKRHRRRYFCPVWMQFGYESQADMDLDRWGEGACRYYAEDPDHPRYERARAAVPCPVKAVFGERRALLRSFVSRFENK